MNVKARVAVGCVCMLMASISLASTDGAEGGVPLRRPTAIRVSPPRVDSTPLSLKTERPTATEAHKAFPLRVVWSRAIPRDTSYAWQQSEHSTPQLMRQTPTGLVPLADQPSSSEGLRLLVGSTRTKGLLLLDSRAGATIERFQLRGGVESPVVFDPASGDLYAGDNAGYVYRMKSDGTKVWEYESLGPILASVGLGDNLVYLHAMDGALVALDKATGKAVWNYRREATLSEGLPLFGSSAPIVAKGMVIAGFEDGHVVAVNEKDGSLAWDYVLVSEEHWQDVDGQALRVDEDRLVISAHQGETVCLKISTGEAMWKAKAGGGELPLLHENTLYIPGSDGTLSAVDVRTGERLWSWETPNKSIPQAPLYWRGALMLATSDGNLYAISPEKGEHLYTFSTDFLFTGFSSTLVSGGDVLFVVSDGGWIHALGATDYQMPVVDPAAVTGRRAIVESSPLM